MGKIVLQCHMIMNYPENNTPKKAPHKGPWGPDPFFVFIFQIGGGVDSWVTRALTLPACMVGTC
jgi:hypothetical protein